MTSSSMSSVNPVVDHQSRFIIPGSAGDLAVLTSHSVSDQAKTTTKKHRLAPSSATVRLQRRYSTGTGTVSSYHRPVSEDFECRVNNHYVPVSLTSRGSDVLSPGKEITDTAALCTVTRQSTNPSSACGEFISAVAQGRRED